MARQARVFMANRHIHVINHFNPELKLEMHHLSGIYNIFLEAKKRFPCKIVSYHIDVNHYHIQLIFPQNDKELFSAMMRWIGTVMAIYVNRRLKRRKGRVFWDRFKSIIKETQHAIDQLFNYINHNAAKHHGINPGDWLYSSYRFYFWKVADPLVG